jgi:hypothetical protein
MPSSPIHVPSLPIERSVEPLLNRPLLNPTNVAATLALVDQVELESLPVEDVEMEELSEEDT